MKEVKETTYHMMHSNIDPSHKILLGYIFAIENFMKIDHRLTGKIEIIFQNFLGTYDRLKRQKKTDEPK